MWMTGTPWIPWEGHGDGRRCCGDPIGMETGVMGLAWCEQESGNEDAFCCNAAAVVPPVTNKNLSVTSLNPVLVTV